MKKADREASLILSFLLFLIFLFAMAGSQGGILVFGIYLYSLLVDLAFVIQFPVFIPSFLHQTEKAFDLTGSLTDIALVGVSVLLGPEPDARSILLAILVVLWAARLGLFLFTRIQVEKGGAFAGAAFSIESRISLIFSMRSVFCQR